MFINVYLNLKFNAVYFTVACLYRFQDRVSCRLVNDKKFKNNRSGKYNY